MEIKGKLTAGIIGIFVGDFLGLPLGGLIGFFLGSLIGHFYFDRPREEEAGAAEREYKRRQGQFLYFAMSLCAKIAKADGPVNRAEMNRMDQLMRNTFRLNDAGRKAAIRIWNEAKDGAQPFEQYAKAFYEVFGREQHAVNQMMDLLFAMAASDGNMTTLEEHTLLTAGGIFRFNGRQYERFKSFHFSTSSSNKPNYGTYSPLDPHYAILGVKPTDSVETIKQKFRTLAMQWHPDKVSAKGASPEAMRHAKEKFQQINEAYETILTARK